MTLHVEYLIHLITYKQKIIWCSVPVSRERNIYYRFDPARIGIQDNYPVRQEHCFLYIMCYKYYSSVGIMHDLENIIAASSL